MTLVPQAIQRAEEMDEDPLEPWTSQQGTRVYRLVKHDCDLEEGLPLVDPGTLPLPDGRV